MTRDEHRAKCIGSIARALDPDWQEIAKLDASYGLAIKYKARRILDSIHGVAFVDPIEATEEMIEEGAKAVAEYQAHLSWDIIGDDLKNAHRRRVRAILGAMSAVGDITNTPEEKP